jgi:hypothetical protein
MKLVLLIAAKLLLVLITNFLIFSCFSGAPLAGALPLSIQFFAMLLVSLS